MWMSPLDTPKGGESLRPKIVNDGGYWKEKIFRLISTDGPLSGVL